MPEDACTLTIRRAYDGVEWHNIRVNVDLQDPKALQTSLEVNARNLDHKDDGTRWLPGYSGEFVPIERPYESVTVVGVAKEDS